MPRLSVSKHPKCYLIKPSSTNAPYQLIKFTFRVKRNTICLCIFRGFLLILKQKRSSNGLNSHRARMFLCEHTNKGWFQKHDPDWDPSLTTGRTVNVGILDTFSSWQSDADEQMTNAAGLTSSCKSLSCLHPFFFAIVYHWQVKSFYKWQRFQREQ